MENEKRGPMKRIVYSINDLTPSAISFLRKGWCVDEDINHFRISKYSILDAIYDSGNGPDLTDIPQSIWFILNLRPEIKSEIENLWNEDENYEIEWE
jgi:hypothetical protein